MKQGTWKIFVSVLALVVVGGLRAGLLDPPVNPADVGDADSFGHNAMFMGAVSGFVILSPNCSAEPPPQPDTQCFNLAQRRARQAPTRKSLCRIKLPKAEDENHHLSGPTFFQNYRNKT